LLLWLLPDSWTNSLYMVPLYIVAAGLHLGRQLRWRPGTTLAQPLLWSLHLAYLFIPLGLLALAAQAAGLPLSLSLASHLLSAGCMGTMILGMIARVSLGHSGRALHVGRRITLAFALVILSAFMRVLLPLYWPSLTLTGWNLSGWSWIAAYGLFVWVYTPILTRPRADGRPG
ncbi:MAG: NnrS family protein, partial [Aeromonas sp.]|nr:NnrS family protein [Aeromonas sp.]